MTEPSPPRTRAVAPRPAVTRRAVLAGAAGAPLALATTTPAAAVPAGGRPRYAWRNVEIVGGGFVPGIVFSPRERGLVYARTDIGGAYRKDRHTDDRWVPLLDWVGWAEWGWTGVVSLAADPVDPDRVYAAVGTYTNDWDPTDGAVLRSRDRGRTWQVTRLPFKLGGNMPGRGMGESDSVDAGWGYSGLTLDRRRPGTLMVATQISWYPDTVLFRSTDSGASWTRAWDVTAWPERTDRYQMDISEAPWLAFNRI